MSVPNFVSSTAERSNRSRDRGVERALDSLPESFRTIVVLVDIEGYGYGEVTENLDVPIGTVRSRLSRARSMLRRSLWEQARTAGLTGARLQRRLRGRRFVARR